MLEYDCSIQDVQEQAEDFYYVRVMQQNGEMVQSSPIWVKK